jgi:hypothetical protein
MNHDAELDVFLHSAAEILSVRVRATESVRSLLSHLPPGDYVLTFNGCILSTSFSFAFYGIQSGSHIYSMPFEPPCRHPPVPLRRPPPCERLCDRESFARVLCELHGADYDEDLCDRLWSHWDKPLAKEVARLRDRFFERVEGTVKCHRKMIRQFFGFPQNDEDEKKKQRDKDKDKDKKEDKKKKK